MEIWVKHAVHMPLHFTWQALFMTVNFITFRVVLYNYSALPWTYQFCFMIDNYFNNDFLQYYNSLALWWEGFNYWSRKNQHFQCIQYCAELIKSAYESFWENNCRTTVILGWLHFYTNLTTRLHTNKKQRGL